MNNPTTAGLSQLTPAEREEYEERAAIIEYDGGLTRAMAERLAMRQITDAQKPIDSKPLN